MTNDLTCRELVELITDYLENALPAADRRRFEDHLAGCTGCTNYLDQMRRTIAAAGTLRESDLPPAARAGLLARFRAWNHPRGERPVPPNASRTGVEG